MNSIKALVGNTYATKKNGEIYKLSFRKHETIIDVEYDDGSSGTEPGLVWRLYSPAGDIVGSGYFAYCETSGYIRAEDANIEPAHRGKGLYGDVLALVNQHVGLVSGQEYHSRLSDEAKRIYERFEEAGLARHMWKHGGEYIVEPKALHARFAEIVPLGPTETVRFAPVKEVDLASPEIG
ncbi:hypothetical protein [Ferrimonas marina]|uniref:N-acetyltransferase domain-containing protein n=1 Tax=Ferrimonas marina TaxID=299255 RepID=A0A1M5TA89_9GAMM|nr:hypothetical protein [Ferrimonas marina]SHH47649.1 hypothetical protein SAMN02745129_2059 [Ferrimonas marina]